MYPIRFKPIYRDYIWGGNKIASFPSREKNKGRIAESWEIVDREGFQSECINGAFRGKGLSTLLKEQKQALLGEGKDFSTPFPILTKIIDAKETLSVQVHPDSVKAKELGGEPKSEIWIALGFSEVYVGLNKKVTPKGFAKAIQEGRVEALLQKITLNKGDAIFIPAGRIHAIGRGSLIYEVQQNSDTTYRLYDWGRDRPLQVEKGLLAARLDDQNPQIVVAKNISSDFEHRMVSLLNSPFFQVERIDIFQSHHIAPTPTSFQIFFCIEGEGQIEVDGRKEDFAFAQSFLVPAASRSIDIEGKSQFIRVRLP